MKNAKSILILLYVITLTLLSACSIANGQEVSDVQETTTHTEVTTSQTTSAEPTTAEPTTVKITTEPTTEEPTELTTEQHVAPLVEEPKEIITDTIASDDTDVPMVNTNIIHKTMDVSLLPMFKIGDVYDTSLKPGDVLAYFTYERFGIYEVPIIYGSEQELVDKYDICLYEYTWRPFYFGNQPTMLFSHNYKSFSILPNAENGDKVFIRTTYGAEYLYQVSSKQIVVPYDDYTFVNPDTGKEVMESRSTHGVLQLVTCANGYNTEQRWLVKAELIDGTKIKEN